MKKSVLILNDDLDVCRQIKYYLQNEATAVYYAKSVEEGLHQFMRHSYTLVIMDITFSEADGLKLLETMRRSRKTPIIVLSSKCSIQDRVQALNAGADDFITQPFDIEECFARAQATMRRYIELGGDCNERCYTLAFGSGLTINPEYRQATFSGEPLELTPKEFQMLYCLAENAGRVLSRGQLYGQLWDGGSDYNVDESVKAHIKSLRKKLSLGGRNYIKNIWGVGYVFDENEGAK